MWSFAVLFLMLVTVIVPAMSAQEPLPVPPPVESIMESASESQGRAGDSLSTDKLQHSGTNPVLACLRIPAVLITEIASRDFTHTSPVDRVLLGTHSRGTAVCQGHVSCEMREQIQAAEVVCRITGTVDSTTRGTNGPALINSTASTTYTATKRIIFDGRKLITQPALVQASSRIQITGVGSSLPGLRGRIVRRVAERRSGESLAEAEAITRDLTVAELQQHIDDEFAQRVDSINRKLDDRLPILAAFEASDYKLSISSQAEFIQLMFVRRDADLPTLHVPATLPLTSKIVLWLPLPGAAHATGSAPAAEQQLQSSNSFDFQNSEQWLLESSQSFLPIWLTAAVTRVQDSLKQRTQRVDLQLHDNWLGVQFGQVGGK